MIDIVSIDGSTLEGGGQILRTACALSAITKKPCHIFNIRKNRPNPGLKNQHLLGLQSLAKLYNGYLEGDEIGSKEIKFYPGEIKNTNLHLKIETAASITLILQTLVLPALFSKEPTKIIFDGGATDTFFSPTIDYFRYVFLKILSMAGGKVELNILKRGYYPEGEAKVEAKISPLLRSSLTLRDSEERTLLRQNFEKQAPKFKPINLTNSGTIKKITAISGASNYLKEKKVAERQLAGVREILGKLKLPLVGVKEYYQTQCPGSNICLTAEFENTAIGVDGLGKLGKKAEDVGKETALGLLKEQKAGSCLDKHLADQILPYMALAPGKSQVSVSKITNHCKTNIWVIEKFIEGKFEIKDNLISWIPL